MEIIIATKNRGKIREIRKALEGLGFQIDGIENFLDLPEVEEDGESFVENALKKARFYSKFLDKLVIADDSGIEVDILKGMPGIHSARYAGEKATDRENNKRLLRELEGVPLLKRGSRFKCAIAMVSPDGREAVTEGICTGRIGFNEVGKKGFGYDPLFILPKYGRTMAQLTIDEKNRVSHRGKALRKLRKIIRGFINKGPSSFYNNEEKF